MGWGDPASSALAILSKHPASFTERLIALDALIRHAQGMPPYTALAESLSVHRKRLKQHSQTFHTDSARIAGLKSFVHDSLNIHPQMDSTSIEFTLPSEVLSRRTGSCLGLSLLYLVYSETLTLPLRPILLPGHVTLRIGEGKGQAYLETLKPDKNRDSLFYDSAFQLASRPWYSPQTAREAETALYAILLNWANQLRLEGHSPWAEELYRFILQRLPGFPPAAGNLALLLQDGNRLEETSDLLKSAAAGDSLSP
jgi:Transglutaminase-like superfamily